MVKEAVTAAKNSDVAVVFAGLSDQYESEGEDRETMTLPHSQNDLILAVARANPNTVVVMNSGNPVAMEPWIDRIKGLVQAWYPGQEGGYAVADVLLGNVNPSGKLPVTFPKRWEDSPAFASYPKSDSADRISYSEGIYVGYRYYDRSGVEPLFSFGFGLSYSQFGYSNLVVNAHDLSAKSVDLDIDVDLENQGKTAGAEVAELYIRADTLGIDRPLQELKGFERVMIEPGQRGTAHFKLDRQAFSYYDPSIHDWTVAPGDYVIELGGSSRDIRVEKAIHLY